MNLDYEHEAQKDIIYALERQKDLMATWQKECFINDQKPKITYENKYKSSSFRRTTKKILLIRSHISIETVEREY